MMGGGFANFVTQKRDRNVPPIDRNKTDRRGFLTPSETIFVITLTRKLLSSITAMQCIGSGVRSDRKQNHVNVLFDYENNRFILVCPSGNPYFFVGISLRGLGSISSIGLHHIGYFNPASFFPLVTGKEMRAAVPLPGTPSLVISSVPLCSCTMRRHIASPSPVPFPSGFVV